MLRRIFFIFLITVTSLCSFSQNVDRTNIISGWKSFFNEQFDESYSQFKRLYKKNTNDIDVIEGLFFSKTLKDGEVDLGFLEEILPESQKHKHYEFGMVSSSLLSYYETPIKERSDNYSFNFNEIKALYTDGYCKSKNGEGRYRNKKKVGLWKYNNLGGYLYKTIEYSDSTNIHLVSIYDDGRKIKDELTKMEEGNGTSSYFVIKKVIYYQELPDRINEYLFVSDTGFCIVNEGKPVKLDKNTPNNVIEEIRDTEMGRIWYIWKNGKKQIYRECELDGIIVWYYQGENPGKYRWENCQKIFIEPLK